MASAGMCVAGAMGITAGSYADNAQVSAEKYEMQVFLDSMGGREIVSGDFSAAIATLRGTPSLGSKYAKNTNLCVALTLTRDFANAEQHCHSAMSFSVRSHARPPSIGSRSLGKKDKVVLALNNLGVFYALSGNTLQARAYFDAAERKGGSHSATSLRNMRALDQRVETVAAL